MEENIKEIIPNVSSIAWGNWEQRTETMRVPELNELFEIPDGKVAIIKIRQATLDEMIRAQTKDIDPDILVQRLQAALGSRDEKAIVDALSESSKNFHPNTEYELKILRSCIVEPKFTSIDIRNLQKLFPTTCNRLSRKILELSTMGGVKKNLGGSEAIT